MESLGSIVVFLFLVFLYWVATRIHSRYFTEDIPNTQYFCPHAEERIPLNEYGESEIVWKDGESAYGYSCTVCGSVHVYDLGIAPAPIYQGDRIKFKVTSDGLVQTQ